VHNDVIEIQSTDLRELDFLIYVYLHACLYHQSSKGNFSFSLPEGTIPFSRKLGMFPQQNNTVLYYWHVGVHGR